MSRDKRRDSSTTADRYRDTRTRGTTTRSHPDHSHTTAANDALPVPVEQSTATDERTYLIVEPSTDQLSPATAVRQFRRLHSLGADGRSSGLRASLTRLFTRRSPPTVECLLLSTGRDDDPLTYAFSVDDADALQTLEQFLRGGFPQSYTITRGRAPAERLRTLFGEDPRNDTHSGTETLAAVEFAAAVDHHRDWQTALTPLSEWYGGSTRGRSQPSTGTTSSTGDALESEPIPLAAVVETMATTSLPMAYQALIRPYPAWTGERDDRQRAIQSHMDTVADQVVDTIVGPPEEGTDASLSMTDERRLADLAGRDPQHSFVVTARVLAGSTSESGANREADPELDSTVDSESNVEVDSSTPRQAVRALHSAFAPVGGTTHRLTTETQTGTDAARVRDHVLERTHLPPAYEQVRTRLRWSGPIRSRGIVVDAHELGSLCLLDGGMLSRTGRRALAPTPPDRTPVPTPPESLLARYRTPGLQLGHPKRVDGQTDPDPVSVPLSLLPLHVAWFGRTGAGKSTSLLTALLALWLAKARDRTAESPPGGATIGILPKGDRMGVEYCRAHLHEAGSLENVHYFDCAEWLPALTFFDIRPDLAAGVPRATAVEDRLAHYVELLKALVGAEQYDRAVRSPDIITYLVKALFDPVHGHDVFPHRALRAAARDLLEGTVPPVSDADLEASLAGVASNRREELAKLVHGVLNRVEKVPVDTRLGRMMNHVASEEQVLNTDAGAGVGGIATAESDPADSAASAGPHFDFGPLLDEHAVVLFDMGRLRPTSQEALSIVLLSNLWSALRRRRRRAPPSSDLPLVSVVLEEAASVAGTDLISELLAQARGFGASMTLAMQFPAQLEDRDTRVYRELLNNVSTVVTGNVAVDRQLAERFATSEMPTEEVRTRLRALARGEWLVSVPAPFGEAAPQPFVVDSAPLPPGHPDGPRPFTPAEERRFERAFEDCCARTHTRAGLELTLPETAENGRKGAHAADTNADETSDGDLEPLRFDSALPYTTRLPTHVWYDDESHALRCLHCDNRYDPHHAGMRRAISCCGSLADVDRDDIPICELNVKLAPDELAVLPWRPAQIRLLQACYHAVQGNYDPLEYDIQRDSMLRLQEYVGADADDVAELVEADLLRKTDHPHRLYTVTPEGRTLLGEGYRQGVDFGDGKGDLEESAEHVLGVRVGERLLEEVFVADAACPATRVKAYHDIDERRRLDIAALDDEGEVVVAVEVERVNHDVRRAAPADFDKMADCGAQEAIWIVMTQHDGHTVLQALNEPLEGKPRVLKTYAETTPPQQFRIETPGLTAMYPVAWVRKRLDDPEWAWERLRERSWE